MSGHSGSTICPNCHQECNEYTDYKPFSHSIISCLNCGLTIGPVVQYMTLRELNLYRADNELSHKTKLPKQEFEY